MTKEPKKDVNVCIDFIDVVVKGHFLACACTLFGVNSTAEPLVLPPDISSSSDEEKLAFISRISRIVVERCTLIEGSFTNGAIPDNTDSIYNYARVLCHFGSLVMEFRDAWHEGDGERVLRCWKLFLPHFKVAGCTKYSLEALKLQIKTGITFLSKSCSSSYVESVCQRERWGWQQHSMLTCTMSTSTSCSSISYATWGPT